MPDPDCVRQVPLTTFYLEMRSRLDLRPKPLPPGFEIRRVQEACPEYNRFLYSAVGWPWFWIDKLSWTYEAWKDHVDRDTFRTWVGYFLGAPAGYFELESQPGDDVEIVYFGLLPQFVGRGLGGALLTAAIENAWDWGAQRVWVHTCTMDHPSALANYLARGFRQYRQEESTKTVPLTPRRDWP